MLNINILRNFHPWRLKDSCLRWGFCRWNYFKVWPFEPSYELAYSRHCSPYSSCIYVWGEFVQKSRLYTCLPLSLFLWLVCLTEQYYLRRNNLTYSVEGLHQKWDIEPGREAFLANYKQLIAHIWYIKILTWLRFFLVIFLYLGWFSLCSSLFWELWDCGVVKNLQFWPGVVLEVWYIVRGLFKRFWNLFDAQFVLEILLSASCPLTSGVWNIWTNV